MKKRYLECGKIVSTHGVKGELRVQPWCDGPDYLCGFHTLYLEEGKTAVRVEQARVHKGMVLLTLEGCASMDDAAAMRGRILYMDREDAPEDGCGFFIQDLIGLSVRDADSGRLWGTLSDVTATGANDVYTITDIDGRQRLIPAIPQVVLKTDLDAGIMLIRPLEGLFDED